MKQGNTVDEPVPRSGQLPFSAQQSASFLYPCMHRTEIDAAESAQHAEIRFRKLCDQLSHRPSVLVPSNSSAGLAPATVLTPAAKTTGPNGPRLIESTPVVDS